MERPDVDVIYLLSPQWFGLHPVELACAAGKPVYCALPLAGDLAELEPLARRVEATGIVVHARVRPPVLPGDAPAQRAAGDALGPPRLILGHSRLFGFDRYAHARPDDPDRSRPAADRPGELPARLVRFLFQSPPGARCSGVRRVVLPAEAGDGAGLRELRRRLRRRARWPRSPTAATTAHAGARPAGSCPPPGFQVYAERGAAWLEMPDRIQWSDAERDPRGAAAAGADRRRRAQRPVPPPGPRASRWPRRSATPWLSPAWFTTCDRASPRDAHVRPRGSSRS